MTDYKTALEQVRKHNYRTALEYLDPEEDMNLYAEIERIADWVGGSPLVDGVTGQVLSNYQDRLIDDLAKKHSEVSKTKSGEEAE